MGGARIRPDNDATQTVFDTEGYGDKAYVYMSPSTAEVVSVDDIPDIAE